MGETLAEAAEARLTGLDAIRRTDCHLDQMGTPGRVSWVGEPGMQVAQVTLRSGLGWRLR
jgi:hypothetical protein